VGDGRDAAFKTGAVFLPLAVGTLDPPEECLTLVSNTDVGTGDEGVDLDSDNFQ